MGGWGGRPLRTYTFEGPGPRVQWLKGGGKHCLNVTVPAFGKYHYQSHGQSIYAFIIEMRSVT